MLSFHLAIFSGCLISAAVLQLSQNLNHGAQAPSNELLEDWLHSNGSLSSGYLPSITHEEWNTTVSGDPNQPIKINCDGLKFDRNLDVKSCFSAYESMKRAAGPEKTFGERNSGQRFNIDDKLPIRYLSCEYT